MQYRASISKRLLALLITCTLVTGAAFSMSSVTASAATKLSVTPSSKTIYVGSKVTLKANKNVKWSIVNKKTNIKFTSRSSRKATIKGVKAGTVYVKAKAGKKYKKIKIVVKSKAPTSINAAATLDCIGVGKHCAVYVKSVTPSSASDAVTFTSSDNAIATVSSTGYVTGIAPGKVIITVKSKYNSAVKKSFPITVVATLNGDITMTVNCIDTEAYPADSLTRVCVPVPQSDDNQNIPESTIIPTAEGAKTCEYTYDSLGNKLLAIEWDAAVDPESRIASVSFHYSRQALNYTDDLSATESGTVDIDAMSDYLQQTSNTGSITSGIVRDTADQIVQTADSDTVYSKADAIYNWVCDNLRYNKKATFAGHNDAPYVLAHTDEAYTSAEINNTFVALCRAAGIPARCEFGLDLSEIDGTASSLVCESQFYLPGFGWVYNDICGALRSIAGYEDRYRSDSANENYKAIWLDTKDSHQTVGNETWVRFFEGEDVPEFIYSYHFEKQREGCGCE